MRSLENLQVLRSCMYRTGNPALNDSTFTIQDLVQEKMTIQGVAEKGFITLAVMLLSGLSVFGLFATGNPELAMTLSLVGWVGGFIFFFVMCFTGLSDNPIAVLAYAAMEGLFLGGLTTLFEASYPGIAIQAFVLTAGVFCTMLVIYRMGLIPVNDNTRIIVFSAMGGVFIIYMLCLLYTSPSPRDAHESRMPSSA